MRLGALLFDHNPLTVRILVLDQAVRLVGVRPFCNVGPAREDAVRLVVARKRTLLKDKARNAIIALIVV